MATVFRQDAFLSQFSDKAEAGQFTGADLPELVEAKNAGEVFGLSGFAAKKVAAAIERLVSVAALDHGI